MRALSLLLPICFIVIGCTSENKTPAFLVPQATESPSPTGAVVSPDLAPAAVEDASLTKGNALDDDLGFRYNGAVTLNGTYQLRAFDGVNDEDICFIPDTISAKKLPDTESDGYLCFNNKDEARKLLKLKPIKWNRQPANVCLATGDATVTITNYEDIIADGDLTDLARLKSVQATSEPNFEKCDWERYNDYGDDVGEPPQAKPAPAAKSIGFKNIIEAADALDFRDKEYEEVDPTGRFYNLGATSTYWLPEVGGNIVIYRFVSNGRDGGEGFGAMKWTGSKMVDVTTEVLPKVSNPTDRFFRYALVNESGATPYFLDKRTERRYVYEDGRFVELK